MTELESHEYNVCGKEHVNHELPMLIGINSSIGNSKEIVEIPFIPFTHPFLGGEVR